MRRLDLDSCKNRVRKARSMLGHQAVSLKQLKFINKKMKLQIESKKKKNSNHIYYYQNNFLLKMLTKKMIKKKK